MMRQITALVSRFPRHELAIHRLYVRDVTFRTICGDHQDAQHALQHWQSRPTPSTRNVRQYRRILKELEAELLGMIESSLNFAHLHAGSSAQSNPPAVPRAVTRG